MFPLRSSSNEFVNFLAVSRLVIHRRSRRPLKFRPLKSGVAPVYTICRDAADGYRCGERAEMKDKNFTVVSEHDRRKGKTDWARVASLTDEEIEAAVRSDPDAAPLDVDWSQAVLVVPPRKKAISIRVDPDVLDYFKKEGAGYQRRINAVLRSYVEQKQKRGKSA
jgi:uncharacterized protein (DUF4415 family)